MSWNAYLRFRDDFAEAIDARLYPIDYLDGLVWAGSAQLIATERSAIVFAVKSYPSGLSDVHGLVAAGNVDEIVGQLIPAAEEWGRRHGCSGALIESRPGWSRILKSSGYEPHQVAVRKEL
jgi:hypothetical protein